nr:hypothetical protein [Tanacetum cinerariifolium]
MKAILRKDKCLAAIGERPAEVMDDSKWDEMDGNTIANLHLALLDGVLSSIEEKKSEKEIWVHLARFNVLLDYLIFDDVAAAILEEENKHTSSRRVEVLVVTRGRSMEPGFRGSHNHSLSKTGKKKNFKCFKCGKPGHFRKDLVANESRKRFADVWLFDMGYTFHMTTRREWFHQYKPIYRGGSVYSCNDHELKIIRIGSIMVKMHDGTVRTIRDVRHVEGLKKNYCLWENWMILVILVERKLLHGLTKVSLPFCKQGVISKQHRLKFKTSSSRSVYVLELVYSDVWQAPVLSLGGAKYFVSFIDDYSRRCWVYQIKKKSNVFEVFKVYKARVELDSGKKITCLRTDNGGEYTGDEFDTFCRQERIKRQFTTAYTPQKNGVAEQMNKTLLERARAMLATASLGKSFWAEAVNTACYVINRSPSTGYCLWDPTAHKVVLNRDVVFMEDKIQENKEGDNTTRETTSIQMEKEFQSNDSFETAPQHEELVPLPGDRKSIGNKWVYKIKKNSDDHVERYRARLVVKGYAQKEEINFNENFSPVVRITTIRVVLPMCATYDLNLEQLDVKSVFLHGNLEEKFTCSNQKALNKKEKRTWSLEYNRIHADTCAYFKRFGNDDLIILLLYVDDMLVPGPNKDHINKLKAQLAIEFEMKDLRPTNKIPGLQIHRDRLSSKMSPSSKKERMEMSRVPYASVVRSLMFAMICTRPDIAHAVGVVSWYMAEPGREHWEAVKTILRYIKGTSDVALCFGDSDLIVTGYVDSDYVGDLDGSKSTTGYVFTLFSGIVSWVLKLQSVAAMSTIKAKYVAAAQASKEAVWLKMLLEELGYKQEKNYSIL